MGDRTRRWGRFVWQAIALPRRAVRWIRRTRRLPHLAELVGWAQRLSCTIRGLFSSGFVSELAHPASHWFHRSVKASEDAAAAMTGDFPPVDAYQEWRANNDWTPAAKAAALRLLPSLPNRCLLSVVMPVHDICPDFLRMAIESVRAQVYPDWELCIGDDASTRPDVRALLADYARRDARIKLERLASNGGISVASNAAAALASGDFLVFLDHDDELSPDCLLELAHAVNAFPDADVLYSDDDKIDERGLRSGPQFKPDWSPELLLSNMYFCHVVCVQRRLFEELGGFRAAFDGSQDHDLALRATERARRVVHIPRILYHWRSLPDSAAAGADKPMAFEHGAKAVAAALERRGIAGTVSRPVWAVKLHHGTYQIDFPDDGPSVSIVIPTKNQVEYLQRCVESIWQHTRYRNYRIVVIDNGSDEPAARSYLQQLRGRCEVLRIQNEDGRFSYARINNLAVRSVDTDFVLFLNNDTEVRSADWLSQMVGYGRMGGVGAVGARLLFPDGTVQHAGVIAGLTDGAAGHAFRGCGSQEPGYMGFALMTRNYSAVTAACMLVRRQLFEDMGGFDETRFAVAFNDVDFCLRLQQRGLRCVYAARAELIHHEGASRGRRDKLDEVRNIRVARGNYRDAYFNPNLCTDTERFDVSTRRQLPSFFVPARPARVLCFSHSSRCEGGPLNLLDLVHGFAARGRIAPEVVFPTDGPVAERCRRAEIPVHILPIGDLPGSGQRKTAGMPGTIAALSSFIRQGGYDVVHANSLMCFPAVLSAQEAGVPVVWSVREAVDWPSFFRRFTPDSRCTALRAFTYPYRVVFASKVTRTLFESLALRKNFTVIRNGLRREPIDRFSAACTQQQARAMIGCPNDRFVVATVGAVCPRKGQYDFVRAAVHLLRKSRAEMIFYIVGGRPGRYQSQIERLARDFPAAIRIVPETEDVYPFFRASDLSVLCSYNESFPRTVQESAAFGLPLVTSRAFGFHEMLEWTDAGATFGHGDFGGLAELIERLRDHPDERRRLAETGRAGLELFCSYDDMVQHYEELLLEAGFRSLAAAQSSDTSACRKVA